LFAYKIPYLSPLYAFFADWLFDTVPAILALELKSFCGMKL
jgi:hypothetical protein